MNVFMDIYFTGMSLPFLNMQYFHIKPNSSDSKYTFFQEFYIYIMEVFENI